MTSAGIVVSGGRSIGSEDDFTRIENDKLGAAVGARAVVDSGYAPVIGRLQQEKLLLQTYIWRSVYRCNSTFGRYERL